MKIMFLSIQTLRDIHWIKPMLLLQVTDKTDAACSGTDIHWIKPMILPQVADKTDAACSGTNPLGDNRGSQIELGKQFKLFRGGVVFWSGGYRFCRIRGRWDCAFDWKTSSHCGFTTSCVHACLQAHQDAWEGLVGCNWRGNYRGVAEYKKFFSKARYLNYS